jgi:mono/diheme cytochrome c family protein
MDTITRQALGVLFKSYKGGLALMLQKRKSLFSSGVVSLALALSLIAYAEKKNPVEATQDSIAKGQSIYKKNCQMCHGEKGRGDGPAARNLKEKPFDFTQKAKMEKLTDEEMFKVISKGEDPMPPFERKLSETDRWHVINFIHTFPARDTSN